MNAEQLNAIKARMPHRDDVVDWNVLRTVVLEDVPMLVAEVERMQSEVKKMFHEGYAVGKRDERKFREMIRTKANENE